MNDELKLDYTIDDPQARIELVNRILESAPAEKLTPHYLDTLSDYIVLAQTKEERREKKILTDNRLVTVQKRETSYQGLTEKLENGEDGIYNLMAGNDKNIILSPKKEITQKDIDEIPGLKELRDVIAKIEREEKDATGRKKYILKKQLIELRQEQYILKSDYYSAPKCTNPVKGINQLKFDSYITLDSDDVPHDSGLLSFFDAEHVSALLCNYQKLKDETHGKFYTDAWCIMKDLDHLIDIALKDTQPIYYQLFIHKTEGRPNLEIQQLLQKQFNVTYSIEYISHLWRNKIPALIVEKAEEEYLIWHYSNVEYGKWKKCSRCGQIKLADNRFFSKNKSSKDSFYSICKACRNKKDKRKEK